MVLEPYIGKLHAPQMQRWLLKHGMAPMLTDELPRLGWFADDVAAGFLRICEGNCGLIDAYITNPDAPAEKRHEALNLITETILRTAKAMGVNKVLAFSSDACIIARAKKQGFAQLPDTIMVLEVR